MGHFKQFLIYACLFLFFGGIFYLWGHYRYNNPKVLKAQAEMHDFLLEAKNDMKREHQKEKFKELMKAKMIQ